jgi:hypothetical protein
MIEDNIVEQKNRPKSANLHSNLFASFVGLNINIAYCLRPLLPLLYVGDSLDTGTSGQGVAATRG